MRSSIRTPSLLLLSALATLASSQAFEYPKCADRCTTKAFAQQLTSTNRCFDNDDYTCLCLNSKYFEELSECYEDNCDPVNAKASWSHNVDICDLKNIAIGSLDDWLNGDPPVLAVKPKESDSLNQGGSSPTVIGGGGPRATVTETRGSIAESNNPARETAQGINAQNGDSDDDRPSPSSPTNSNKEIIIGASVGGGVAGLILFTALGWWIWKRQRRARWAKEFAANIDYPRSSHESASLSFFSKYRKDSLPGQMAEVEKGGIEPDYYNKGLGIGIAELETEDVRYPKRAYTTNFSRPNNDAIYELPS